MLSDAKRCLNQQNALVLGKTNHVSIAHPMRDGFILGGTTILGYVIDCTLRTKIVYLDDNECNAEIY